MKKSYESPKMELTEFNTSDNILLTLSATGSAFIGEVTLDELYAENF